MESIFFDTYELGQATDWLRHELSPPHAKVADRMGLTRQLFSQKLRQVAVNVGYDKRHTFTTAELKQLTTLRRELHTATADRVS